MGVQDRDWYHHDKQIERRANRDKPPQQKALPWWVWFGLGMLASRLLAKLGWLPLL